MDIKTLAAARKYVDDTANALGAVKGSPCTITSITEADDGIHIIFSWTGTDGTVATQTAIMPYVAVDKVAREAIETLREDMGEAIDTTVRSINGRKPDSKGNVALPLSVTGVPNTGSPNQAFVTDPSGNPVWEVRTHGGKRITVDWDGTYDKSTDTSGSNFNNSTFLNGMQRYWKISDLIPSKEELFSDDAFCTTTDGESNVYPEKVWENDGWYGRWELIEKPLETLSLPIILVITKPGQYMGYNFTETGIHTFAGSYGKKQKFASLTYGWFKQLDKMYLPEDIGGGMPEGGAPNQMLVTDTNGNTKWEDRTHYEEPGPSGVHYESPDGLESVTLGGQVYYKISEHYPDPTKIVFTQDPDVVPLYDGYSSAIATADSPCWFIHYAGGFPRVVATSRPDALLENSYWNNNYSGMTVPSPGVWAAYPCFGENWMSFEYTGSGKVHKLDPKFLPDGYPYEAGESTLVRDWGTLTFEVTAYGLCAIVDPMDFEEGVSYAFLFDGVEYVCKPVIRDDGKFIGNGSIWGIVSDDTGEPFCFAYEMGQIHTNSAGDHTMSVSKGSTEIHPLDPKFLPPDITIPSGGSLTIKEGATVNDEAGVMGGDIKTAIIRANSFQNAVNGNDTIGEETFEVVGMTFAELKTALLQGGPVLVFEQSGGIGSITNGARVYHSICDAIYYHETSGYNEFIELLMYSSGASVYFANDGTVSYDPPKKSA